MSFLKFKAVKGVADTYEVRRGDDLLGCVMGVQGTRRMMTKTGGWKFIKVRRWAYQAVGADRSNITAPKRIQAASALAAAYDSIQWARRQKVAPPPSGG